MKKRKWIAAIVLVFVFTMMFGTTAFATGDVASAIEGTWDDASEHSL